MTLLVVLAGLVIHIGLGYRLGLVVAGAAIAGHLLLGVAARRLWRRRAAADATPPSHLVEIEVRRT
ncbi:hypothetical protein [Lentzea aerocolonigenes]|uniref:hypothetical protein n=1 Tax=Lentzea aerocolonigenes TaxID=68170 RepID=UPI0020A32AC6|nr:hypothetical protein [Lentzea aerocolonigenes]